jgi:hypothetical protein
MTKPQLKMQTKTVHHVDDADLDAFVKALSGHEFSFAADRETGNDTSHEFIVDGDMGLFGEKAVAEFMRTGRGDFIANDLLNSLAKHGYIPKGDYVVRVAW